MPIRSIVSKMTMRTLILILCVFAFVVSNAQESAPVQSADPAPAAAPTPAVVETVPADPAPAAAPTPAVVETVPADPAPAAVPTPAVAETIPAAPAPAAAPTPAVAETVPAAPAPAAVPTPAVVETVPAAPAPAAVPAPAVAETVPAAPAPAAVPTPAVVETVPAAPAPAAAPTPAVAETVPAAPVPMITMPEARQALERTSAQETPVTPVKETAETESDGGKPRVAFYFVGTEPKEGIYRPLGGQITAAFVKSGDFISIDRTEALNELLTGERVYQMSGAVDDSQISELGKEWGVQYVIPVEVTKSVDGFYIETKMVDVTKSHIVKMGHFSSKLESSADVAYAADVVVAQLLGRPIPERPAGASPIIIVQQAKKMMFGVKLCYSVLELQGKERLIKDQIAGYYPYYAKGAGTGFGAGLVAGYIATERIGLSVEILYFADAMEMTQNDLVYKNKEEPYEYDNYESMLSIQLAAMYHFLDPKKFVAPYVEFGLRSDIVLSSQYVNTNTGERKRAGSDAGIIAGVGLNIKTGPIRSYINYRLAYNITNFDKDGHGGMYLRYTGGLTVMY